MSVVDDEADASMAYHAVLQDTGINVSGIEIRLKH